MMEDGDLTSEDEDRNALKRVLKDDLIDIIIDGYKDKYEQGLFDGDAANIRATTELITGRFGQPLGVSTESESEGAVVRKPMTLDQLIAYYQRNKILLEAETTQREATKINLDRVGNECRRLQNIIANREYTLECYRTVMADAHQNIKLNPEVLPPVLPNAHEEG